MAHITEERCPGLHRLYDPPFLLLAHILLEATPTGDQPPSGLRLMAVALIHDTDPRGLGVGGHRLRPRRRNIFFSSCRTNGGRHDFSRRPIAMRDQALRPMPNVCRLGALDHAWLHGQGGRSALQGLAPRLLICADDVAPLRGEGWRLLVDLTSRRHVVGTHLGSSGLRVEPVRDPMRLHIGLMVKNARHCGC